MVRFDMSSVRSDAAAILIAQPSPLNAAYVGLLGSKRRGRSIKEFLNEGGMDQSLLDRLHVPTGLDIGAGTAQEIALSILAEAVAVKAGRRGASLKERE